MRSWTALASSGTRRLAKLLNVRYQMLLLDTLQSLSSSRATDLADRKLYANWAISEMEFIKKIAQLLPHLPLGVRIGGKKGAAAAPFELTEIPSTLPAQLEMLAIRGFLEFSLGDVGEAQRFLGPLPDATAKAGFGEPALFRFHGDAIETLRRVASCHGITAKQ